MTDYDELVKALRGKFIAYDATGNHNSAQLYKDAAAAIEELQADVERLKAENPIVETVLVDKMRQQMEETVCHCNVKENAELIAKILDDDVDRKVFELPKRGEWSEENRRPRSSQFVCSVCHRTAYDPQPTRDKAWRKRCRYSYCPNCGAKMTEAQDEA